uniref:E3 ubiquitin-protein ligase n=1 Tax=Panagrolaimus sp. JU765 TaxID=591449 RepID=A0AC34RA16_9BILA
MGDELDAGVDFNTLLEWIDAGDRDLQISALEHLCMTLLMSDNVDRCFENCPPRQFMPALCRIFLDENAPVLVLEAAARAMTYYMDVSNECSRRITSVEGTVKAICDRIALMSVDAATNKELVEQCVKVLEHICQRETGLVYEAGGFSRILTLVRDFSTVIHKDILRSAMAVITRLCSKIEPNDALQSDYSVTLNALLDHDDLRVSESALRSIAAIVDRFLRKNMDPYEFVSKCDLVESLLTLIVKKDENSEEYVLSGKPIFFISIVLSLLSNLCRGSANATDLVVPSKKLVPMLKAVMTSKDERCVMDGLRLTGMILGLICEGRGSFSKSGASGTQLDGVGTPKYNNKHKQLIESIRNKDFTSFKNIVDTSNIDVNYTDDVGQALLNWVSAFGTVEMAKLLLEKGANIDGGNRSSSLHYAAIFGRPDIARLLLESGANPELRDEEGRTPLERARERHEDGHKQVARLLESPLTKQYSNLIASTLDPEILNELFIQLVPIFCNVSKVSFSVNIKRSALSLMRKCVTHINTATLRAIITQNNGNNEFAESFLGMLETTIDREDDSEIREQLLLTMDNLLKGDLEFWREQIARLGVHEKIEVLAEEEIVEEDDDDTSVSEAPPPPPGMVPPPHVAFATTVSPSIPPPATPGPSNAEDSTLEDGMVAVTIYEPNKPSVQTPQVNHGKIHYGVANLRWGDWRILLVNKIIIVWSDAICIRFANDGSVTYLADSKIGQLQLFLSKNKPDDTPENRIDFIQNFIVFKDMAFIIPCEAVFADRNETVFEAEGWKITCTDGEKLEITYQRLADAKMEINQTIPGFTYFSGNEKTETIVVREMLDDVFVTGWKRVNKGNICRSKKTACRIRVRDLANKLWERYLKYCKNNIRSELRALQDYAKDVKDLLREFCVTRNIDPAEVERKLYNTLEQVRDALISDTLSVFEIAHSGIVEALYMGFGNCMHDPPGLVFPIFCRVFSGEQVMNTIIKKMVLVLEAMESFPVIRYDKPNGTLTGMKLLTRRFRFQLKQANPKNWLQQKLINNTGRTMKVDPLCSGEHIKSYLLQMLSKFWFDAERNYLEYVRKILEAKKSNKELVFHFGRNFDEKGILFFIGTNGYAEKRYKNPASCGLIKVSSTDGSHMPYDSLDEIFNRSAKIPNCHTNNIKESNITMDLGIYVYPTAYTLRHSGGYTQSALRNWTFEGSSDNRRWYVISRHIGDETLSHEGDQASWTVSANVDIPFRYFRIVQRGLNASGSTYFLSLGGFELYGHVVDAITDPLPNLFVPRLYSSTTSSKYVMGRQARLNWAYRHGSSEDTGSSRGQRSSTSPSDLPVIPPASRGAVRERVSANVDLPRSAFKFEKSRYSKKETAALAGPLDNSSPPILIKIRESTSGRKRFPPSPVDYLHNEPELKTVTAISRPPVVFKTEKGRPKIKCGNIVKNVSRNLIDKTLYGRALSDVENGRIKIQWDNGKIETVSYGTNGCYEVALLLNQLNVFDTDKKSADTHEAGSSIPAPNPASTMYQKSMSTTNLTDDRRNRRSIAATNQAASAESLQHQTPSLENLLARARVFTDRIPEAGDEQSPVNTPEPTNNEQNLGPSVAASTFGGGSHPVLSTTRRSIDSDPSRTSANSISSAGIQRSETDVDGHNTRQRGRWAPDSSSQELFNEEDEANLQNHGDVENAGDDDYYSYQFVNEDAQNPEEDEDDDEEDEDDDDEEEDDDEEDETGFGQEAPILDATGETPSVDSILVEHLRALVNEDRNSSGANSTGGAIRPIAYSSYAEALRNVMSQVMEVSDGNDEDEIIFNDELDEENTDETEEDLDELINQNIVSPFDPSMIQDHFTYRMIANNPSIIWGDLDGGRRIRVIGEDGQAARIALRQLAGVPHRFYEMMAPSNNAQLTADTQNHGLRTPRKPTRHWDDDFTLKPTYDSLIPVFDPRPGRNNVNQIQDVGLPPDNVDDDTLFKKDIGLKLPTAMGTIELEPKDLRLYISGPNIAGIDNATIEIVDDEHKLLFYIQQIMLSTKWYKHMGKRFTSKIWEPTFTLTYEVIGTQSSTVKTTELDPKVLKSSPQYESSILCAFDMLTFMEKYVIVRDIQLNEDTLISQKLSQKIMQQLNDPLLVASNSLAEWTFNLLSQYKHLFTLNLRWDYMMATAFGAARSIIWAQNALDQAHEQNQAQFRRDDINDFRIGRLKHERIKVPRGDDFFETAIRVLKFHAVRKSMLEIQYHNEEGTGLGPTLEFYSLVAAEFQRKIRAMWICDDHDEMEVKHEHIFVDGNQKPPGYYVRRSGGLFPAPIPPNTEESEKVCNLFRVFGIFLGKVLQDKRMVDIPFSPVLLRLLSMDPQDYEMDIELLSLFDFEQFHPEKAQFIRELMNLRDKRNDIWNDHTLNREQRLHKIQNLKIEVSHAKCTLDEIGLTFVVDPPSSVFEYRTHELIENGANVDVTLCNLDEYIEKVLDFHLSSGIRPQLDALRHGFSLVCPLASLGLFTPAELLTIFCGDQCPQWTFDELMKYSVGKNGYTQESRTFRNFCQVLVEMNGHERKSFLQFATGCSSLPPGGLANLVPPLTIVRKGDCGDGAYPSVNTCVHYLKVPDYSSKEILKERLLSATLQKGFHLN